MNLRQGKPRALETAWRARGHDHVTALGWSSDGRWAAAICAGGGLVVAAGVDGHEPGPCGAGHDVGGGTLSWRPGEALLATGGQDGRIRLWRPGNSAPCGETSRSPRWVERVVWTSNGRTLAAAVGRRVLFFGADLELLRGTPDHASTVVALDAWPGGPELSACAYGAVTVWRPDRPEPLRELKYKGSILASAVSPDRKHLAAGNQDATVHFWRLDSERDLEMSGYPSKIRRVRWDSGSRWLATACGPTLVCWDAKRRLDGSKPIQLEGHAEEVTDFAFAPDRPRLAAGGRDGRVLVWDLSSPKIPVAGGTFSEGVSAIAWSPDGSALLIGGEQGAIAAVR